MQNTSQPHPQHDPLPSLPHASMLEAALDYARKGWRVLPLHGITPVGTCTCGNAECRNVGNHPLSGIGVADATIDLQTIRQWWHAEPTANVGIATGQGLLVFDIHPGRGGSLLQMQEFYALPLTAMAQTSSGSWHLYFTYNRELMLYSNVDKLQEGVICLGEGAYVVAPPSCYVPDRCFTWYNTLSPVPLPAVLLPALLNARSQPLPAPWELVREPEDDRRSSVQQAQPSRAQTLLQTLPLRAVPATGRIEDASGRVPVALIRSDTQRYVALANIAEELWLMGVCEDVLRISLNAFNRMQCRPPLAREDVLRIVGRVPQHKRHAQYAKHPDVGPLSLQDLLDESLMDVPWIVPEMLPEGVTVLTGKPRAGKSALALSIALAVATATPVLGKRPPVPGAVLFLNLEDSRRRMRERSRRLLQGSSAPSHVTWAGDWSYLEAGGLADLEEWLVAHPTARLVVIDTLAMVCSPGVTPHARENYALLEPLKLLASQHHIAILLVHHLKNATSTLDEMHSPLARHTDCQMLLQRVYGQPYRKLHLNGRYLSEQNFLLEQDAQTGAWCVMDDAQ